MAKNPNTKYENNHTGYLAKSGSGKSQVMMQNKDFPSRGVRAVLWDISHDHEIGTTYYNNKSKFVSALLSANSRRKSFRIGWDGDCSPESLEFFLKVVWSILDGNKLTYIIIEELAASVSTSSVASYYLKKICNESRKFGGILHYSSQRPQEIPKTVYDTTNHFWVGRHKPANRKRFAELIEVTEQEIKALSKLEFFYYDEDSDDEAVKIKFQWKEPRAKKR